MDKCGTRTELCNDCKRYIQIKDQDKHFTSNCKYPPVNEPKPSINRKEANITNPFLNANKPIDTSTFYKNKSNSLANSKQRANDNKQGFNH